MQKLGKFNPKINVVPNGLGKYMDFSINSNLSFIDSFQFLSSSLDRLVKNLNKDEFKFLTQELDKIYERDFILVNIRTILKSLRKNYVANESFFSSLMVKEINEKEHEHVVKVWKKFEIKPMKGYRYLHLKCGGLLSTDVFEKFRINRHGLCPSHYLSAPALSWDEILNMTKLELKLIPDPDIYMFFQKGTRGEGSYISNRYSKAENEYMKSCDPFKNQGMLYT